MTETSPLCTIGRLLPKHEGLSEEERTRIRLKQGRGVWGVDLKIVDDDGRRLPWDGKAFGEVWVRGPWIASGYFKGEGGEKLDGEGFFPTGDVATIDPDGYLQLVDRAKDVIKSGGEWVSSIDLENAAMGHPAIAEAAVIGVPHPKWQERPVLIAVLRKGTTPPGRKFWSTWVARSSSGGCPTTWCSSTNCPTPPPARSSSSSCASSTATTRCRVNRPVRRSRRSTTAGSRDGHGRPRSRGLSVELADEPACGDEDLTGHILGEITDQVGVCRRDVLRRRGVQHPAC